MKMMQQPKPKPHHYSIVAESLYVVLHYIIHYVVMQQDRVLMVYIHLFLLLKAAFLMIKHP